MLAVELVEAFAGRNPECSLAILAARADVVAAEAHPVRVVVRVVCRLPAHGVETVQATFGRDPERTGAILADVVYPAFRAGAARQWVVHKGLAVRIVATEPVHGADPERARSIYEQRGLGDV